MVDSPQPTPPPTPPRRRSSATAILLALTALGGLAFVGSAGAVWYLVSSVDEGDVESGTFLEVELSGVLSDEPAQGSFVADPSEVPPTVTELADAIRAAGTDDRIDGLYLSLEMPQGGWASFQELRDAVGDFRAEGKPCVAYTTVGFSNADYYLASSCGTVLMAPSGAMLVTGLSSRLTYYKGTFDKLGVTPEFEHVGDFKSFIETYERTSPSSAAAEAYEVLLDSLYEQLVAGIAEGRELEPDVVRDYIDHPGMTPASAIERGLVDGTAYPDAVRAHVQDVADEGWLAKLQEPVDELDDSGLTSVEEYVKGVRARSMRASTRIAVVQAQGNIVSGDGGGGLFGDNGTLADGEFSDWMEDVRDDDSVKAVVVRVNSPGGSGLASSLMWREVARTKAAGKPVVVSMGDLAASGGYLMSANADWIVAQPGTITGSIGVFGGKFDLSGLYTKLGMTQHVFERGDESDLLSFSAPFSEDGRAIFKGYLSAFYDEFVGLVAEGRGMAFEDVHAVAQGRVWTGEQALGHGLVDELGGLDTALAKAAALGEIEGDYGTVRWPRAQTFFDLLMKDLSEAEAAVDLSALIPVPLDAATRGELSVLEQAGRTGAAITLLPGGLTIR